MQAEVLKQKGIFSLLIYGMRPKTLFAAGFPVVLGMLLARFDGHYNITIYLCTLFSALFLQIGTNFANDYFDGKAGRDTKKRLGPLRIGSLNLLPKYTLLTAMVLSFAVTSLLTSYLIVVGGDIIIYLLILGICLSIFYSYGKYSLANTGLSNLIVFIVFGPLASLITYYLQTGVYEVKASFFGIIPGSLSLMLFAMNNLRDIEEDKACNKKTLVVRFGFQWGKREYISALFASWITIPLSMMLYNAPIITLLPLILMPKGIGLGKEVLRAKTPEEIVPLFNKTAKYNIIYALTYIISWRIASL